MTEATLTQDLVVHIDISGPDPIYLVDDRVPGTPASDKPLPEGQLRISYEELVDYLLSRGFTPLTRLELQPTAKEKAEGRKDLVRKVTKNPR